MNKKFPDHFSLTLVTGHIFDGPSFFERIRESIRGGVDVVQLRLKGISDRILLSVAEEVMRICSLENIPLIINDRVDIAYLVGADGVHLGASDIPYYAARRLLGEDKIIGVSVERGMDVESCLSLNPSYIGVSPLYKTSTKADAGTPWGVSGLTELVARADNIPLITIGGISADNVSESIAAGASGVAVVSAIWHQHSPEAASARFIQQIRRASL